MRIIPKLTGLKTLDELPKVSLKWILQGVIKEQTITQFFGLTGVGKTILSLAITKQSLDKYLVEQVIYIDCDNGLSRLDDLDLMSFIEQYKDRFDYYADYDPKRFEQDFCSRDNLAGVLIIIDGTINFIDGGKMNADENAISFMKKLKELRAKGATIIFHNHPPKYDENIAKGSNQFENYSDENFKLQREKGSNTYTITPKKKRFAGMAQMKIQVDIQNFEIKNIIYLDDELFKLDDKQKVTLYLCLLALEKSMDGLNKTELTSKINKLQNDMHYEIVGRNNLWTLLKEFSGKLFKIKKGCDPAKPNEKVYKILDTKEAKNLREKLEAMAEF